MDEPSRYEKRNLKFFTASARIVGYGFVFVSALAIVVTISFHDAEYPLWSLIVFIPVLVLGFMMTRVKPYYPAKYREWYEQEQRLKRK